MQLSNLALPLVFLVAAFLPVEDELEVDYEAILESAREQYALEGVDLENYSVAELLAGDQFVQIELGGWDFRFPAEACLDKGALKILSGSVNRTLDVARVWATWTMLDEVALEETQADIEILQKWVGGWSNRDFKKSLNDKSEGLFRRLPSVNEKVLAAGQRFYERMALKKNVDGTPAAEVVFCPTRRSFVQLCTLVGAIEPKRKEVLWGTDAAFQSAAWSTNIHFIALEYAAWPWNDSQVELGESMDTYVKSGRDQHVVERIAASLSRGVFNSMASPLLEQALHINLVIEILGEEFPSFSSWSFQFSRAGGSTSPYSRFVPGGNSAGGTLPPRPATAGPTTSSSSSGTTSSWRDKNGHDFYKSTLKKGQKKGLKLALKSKDVSAELRRDKLAHFAIGILGKSEAIAMSAPFLGDDAENKAVPDDEFVNDYEEFFRAYRTCFSHWLRTAGNSDGEQQSANSFALLLERARNRGQSDTLSSMVEEIYGLPLSAVNGETDSLEWRFLKFISK